MSDGRSDPIFELVISLLRDAHREDSPLCAPEDLYNEGWLLRLSLALESAGVSCLPFRLLEEAIWLSEPLLYSPFQARTRGDELAERHTQADAVVGHVAIAKQAKRGLRLRAEARQFIVIESKLGSPLQPGTQNAPDYDQAVRNVVCMAEILKRAERPVAEMDSLGFYVISPASKIAEHKPLLEVESMEQKVAERIAGYPSPDRERLEKWRKEWFDPLVQRAEIRCVAWEDVVDSSRRASREYGDHFQQFYDRCIGFAGQKSVAPMGGTTVQPEAKSVYIVDDELVVITRRSDNNCRVIPLEFEGPYFPESKLIATYVFGELEPETGNFDVKRCRPAKGAQYLWDPPAGEDCCPPGNEDRQPEPPCRIVVIVPGSGDTSRVGQVDTPQASFLVYTHHLRAE